MGRKTANKQGSKHGHDGSAACGPHVAFYKGAAACSEGTLVELLAWKGNYKKLEENHTYIQWLFPNYFDSKFNAESRALTHDEACIFREDLDIAQSYLKSYRLFLDFLGLQLLDVRTGTVGRARGGGGRLRKALVHYIHNHLRVYRVLSSLAVTGFQRYLTPLVAYLRWEITGHTEQLLDFVTDLSRITCGERPVLTELAKPASKSDRCFLDVLNNFVDGNAKHFRASTKSSMDDDVVSILLQEKDQKALMHKLSKSSGNEQAPCCTVEVPVNSSHEGSPAVVCACCEGTGAVIVIGICPLCEGLGVMI